MDLFDIAFARKNVNAISADKLSTPINISLSGDITSQSFSFDGTSDLVIITEVNRATEEDILALFLDN